MAHPRKPATLALAVALASLSALAQAESLSSKLQINGFATAGATWVTDDFNTVYLADAFKPGSGIDENGNFTEDNVLGIQLAYALDDKLDLVGQLVSKGHNDYQTNADWAYIAYKANNQLRVRGGRFAAPLFNYSENRNVGQAYPWARLPVEIYAGVPVNNIDGLDAIYRQPLGDWNLDAQFTAGSTNAYYGSLKKSLTGNLTMSNDVFSVRAGYSSSKLSLRLGKDPFGTPLQQLAYLMNSFGVDMDTDEVDASFADVGVIYDDSAWMVIAEYGQLRIDGYLSDRDAAYLTVGHYFGKWLPYVMFAKSNTVNGDECYSDLSPALTNATNAAAFAAGTYGLGSPEYAAAAAAAQAVGGAIYINCQGAEQTTYSAGFRYDMT